MQITELALWILSFRIHSFDVNKRYKVSEYLPKEAVKLRSGRLEWGAGADSPAFTHEGSALCLCCMVSSSSLLFTEWHSWIPLVQIIEHSHLQQSHQPIWYLCVIRNRLPSSMRSNVISQKIVIIYWFCSQRLFTAKKSVKGAYRILTSTMWMVPRSMWGPGGGHTTSTTMQCPGSLDLVYISSSPNLQQKRKIHQKRVCIWLPLSQTNTPEHANGGCVVRHKHDCQVGWPTITVCLGLTGFQGRGEELTLGKFWKNEESWSPCSDGQLFTVDTVLTKKCRGEDTQWGYIVHRM